MLAWTARLAVVLLLFAGLTACGHQESTPVRSVHGYLDALAGGDGEKACSYLTFVEPRGNCAESIRASARHMSDSEKSKVRSMPFEIVSVHGRTAIGRFLIPKVPCSGGPKRREPFTLVRSGGNWRILVPRPQACLLSAST
jgi:hypothetical protein